MANSKARDYSPNELAASQPGPTAEVLNALLLNLYDAARSLPGAMVQRQALGMIESIVAFDACMYGIGIERNHNIIVNDALMIAFPDDSVDVLNRLGNASVVGRTFLDYPERAHCFSLNDGMVGAGDHSLWRRLGGLRHVLCYGRIDKNSGAFSYLVFARHGGRKPFTPDDRKWIELVAPHLNGMLQGARGLDLHRLRLGLSSDDWRCAICDVRGLVLVAEAGFEDLVRHEWSGWTGPFLPREMAGAAFGQGTGQVVGERIKFLVSGAFEQLVVTAVRRSPVDQLTPQEHAVAKAFAQGASYKEVARTLGKSPATVRQHLRSVYSKLNIRDKGALAQMLAGKAAGGVEVR